MLGVFGRSKSMDDRDKTRSGDAHAQVKNYVLHGYVLLMHGCQVYFAVNCIVLIIPLQILYL